MKNKKYKEYDLLSMKIVNFINETNKVSVKQRQNTNDFLFDFAYEELIKNEIRITKELLNKLERGQQMTTNAPRYPLNGGFRNPSPTFEKPVPPPPPPPRKLTREGLFEIIIKDLKHFFS